MITKRVNDLFKFKNFYDVALLQIHLRVMFRWPVMSLQNYIILCQGWHFGYLISCQPITEVPNVMLSISNVPGSFSALL